MRLLSLLFVLLPLLGFAEERGKYMSLAHQGQALSATIRTSKGNIVVRLFSKDAPKTVANFVGLATGEKTWKHPKTGAVQKGKPLYDGVVFHRVIPGFMIQGGDPLGEGFGGPGYTFEDELGSGRKFDRKGLLAMANSGRNTNGSQFFITTAERLPHLDGGYTIFGEVVSGYDVVVAISQVKTGPGNKPVEPVVIRKVEISEAQKKQ